LAAVFHRKYLNWSQDTEKKIKTNREERPVMKTRFEMVPIGRVEKQGDQTVIEVFEPYREALDGLDGFSHIWVLYWFDQNDTPRGRSQLKVHPRKDPSNPLTGVFATHAPVRPNLVAMTRCRIRFIRDLVIGVEDLDALDGSPVIDIKCYLPEQTPDDVRVPPWVARASRPGR
jgi:tRNA-Thr(GGU) m(6)t(6)A37 methyltransferase TsaA